MERQTARHASNRWWGEAYGHGKRESLGGFLRRRLGSEFTDTLLEPLMAGIYGSDSDDMSLDALFPMLEEWERRYGSVTRGMREVRKAERGAEQPPSAFFSLNGGNSTGLFRQSVASGLKQTEIVGGRAAVAVDRIGRCRASATG